MTHSTAREQAEQFLAQSGEFRLGKLVTEASHPRTRRLSETARITVTGALSLLFGVDADVLSTYVAWIETGAPARIKDAVLDALLAGGRIFFTGCGATGRLSILLEAIWRDFWSRQSLADMPSPRPSPASGRGSTNPGPLDPWTPGSLVSSVMAGGDFALIKSVEGLEDFMEFGAKQIESAAAEGDVVFAITEGGETSFVIGTAWQALEKGAKVYFVYNNPDPVLRKHVARSREILDEPRIEKINLTTGPMAIMGSTRMQATSIQLCAMLTVLEMVARDLLAQYAPDALTSDSVPQEFLASLGEIRSSLNSERTRRDLAGLVYLEETIYRLGRKSAYFANGLAIDVLTDTTERSPTFCIPAFRKWDDNEASESWTHLILPYPDSKQAWEGMLKRPLRGLAWSEEEIRNLVGPEKAAKQAEIMKRIGTDEIPRFRIGLDGLESRPIEPGDAVVCIISEAEKDSLISPDGFYRTQIEAANAHSALAALVFLGRREALEEVEEFLLSWDVLCPAVLLEMPDTDFLLDGITHAAIKMLLNALSTCVMVRLGRVIGNCMVAVMPSNLKLIDRCTRYIQSLTGLSYEDSCRALFESIEYVAPRMQAGQSHPPVVALSVMRVRDGCSFEEAESRLKEGLYPWSHE